MPAPFAWVTVKYPACGAAAAKSASWSGVRPSGERRGMQTRINVFLFVQWTEVKLNGDLRAEFVTWPIVGWGGKHRFATPARSIRSGTRWRDRRPGGLGSPAETIPRKRTRGAHPSSTGMPGGDTFDVLSNAGRRPRPLVLPRTDRQNTRPAIVRSTGISDPTFLTPCPQRACVERRTVDVIHKEIESDRGAIVRDAPPRVWLRACRTRRRKAIASPESSLGGNAMGTVECEVRVSRV
jgi:hypothetical protein